MTFGLVFAHADLDAPRCAAALRGPGLVLRFTPRTAPTRAAAVTPLCAGRRILVADADPYGRRQARALLAALGCQARAAASGPEALAALSLTRFDLVLLDLNLPGMDGFETGRRIRLMARDWGAPPVVALTAAMTPRVRDAAAEAGIDGFLARPLALARLADRIALLTARPLIEAAEFHDVEEEDQDDKAADDRERGHVAPRDSNRSRSL